MKLLGMILARTARNKDDLRQNHDIIFSRIGEDVENACFKSAGKVSYKLKAGDHKHNELRSSLIQHLSRVNW